MENVENTEVIEERIESIPSKKPIAFGFSDFFDRNKKIVTYGGGGLLILILAVGYYFYRNNGREEEAQNAMFRAQRYYEADSVNLALKGDGTASGMGMIEIADEYSGTKSAQLAHYYI